MDISRDSLSVGIFTWFSAILRLKERKKKKVPIAIKLDGRGGGKALMAWP